MLKRPPRQPAGKALGLCLVNWLVPGAGYLAAGDRVRGLSFLFLLNGCFILGLVLDGIILTPSLPNSPSFNIVAALTFLVQVFHGGGTLGVVLAQRFEEAGVLGLLARSGTGAYADLGAFHLLVAGGLNYLACVQLWDFLTGSEDEGGVGSGDGASAGSTDGKGG
jgi:hypothetical protein